MEFDKSKILTVVTADQLKEGQMGWINDCVDYLKSDIKNISPYKVFRTNENMSIDDFPFAAEGRGIRRYFYPAPEPTYAERQAQWVKENNVKEGTKVRVTRAFTSCEDGCNVLFAPVKSTLIGDDCTIDTVCDRYINVRSKQKDDWWSFPYFVLEVVKEPTYRPFKNAEEFKPYRDKWCIDNLKGRFKIDWHSDTHIYEYGNSFITWEEAFGKYKFEDGTAFGIKEEV